MIKFDLRTEICFFARKMPQISHIGPYLRPTLDYMVIPREQQGNDCPALQYVYTCLLYTSPSPRD